MGLFDKLFKKKKPSISPEDAAKLLQLLQAQQAAFQQGAQNKERNTPISQEELMQIFAAYFAPNTDFYAVPGSEKFTAYFQVVNAATEEMQRDLPIFKAATKWTPEQLAEGMQPNGDSIYTYSAGYICRNLPNTAKLLLRSFSAQGAQWVQGVLGTALGEPIVYTVDASWVLGVGFILALLAAALPQAGETVPLGRRTKAGVWGIVLCVIALSFVTALNWTPINYTTIFGLQGRYWLPVLPLVLALVHHNRTFAVQKPAERKAVFAMLCLTSFVILQGAGLYATFQMPS